VPVLQAAMSQFWAEPGPGGVASRQMRTISGSPQESRHEPAARRARQRCSQF